MEVWKNYGRNMGEIWKKYSLKITACELGSYSRNWGYMLALQALAYIEGSRSNRRAHTILYHRNPDTLKGATHIAKLVYLPLGMLKPSIHIFISPFEPIF